MVYGFSGAHRSGKTTLARRIAEDFGFEFLETKTGEVMKAHGIDIVANMPIADRITAQEILLDHHIKVISAAGRPLITDRTPLDMLAYTLGEVFMNNITMTTEESRLIDKRIKAYSERCMREARRHYHAVVIVRPLSIYVDEEGKPPASRAYQDHFDMLVTGAATRANVRHAILKTDDLDDRVEATGAFIIAEINALAKERGERVEH